MGNSSYKYITYNDKYLILSNTNPDSITKDNFGKKLSGENVNIININDIPLTNSHSHIENALVINNMKFYKINNTLYMLKNGRVVIINKNEIIKL